MRQFSPDLCKAAAIFGVVYIHSYWMFLNPITRAINWISALGVPIFIIIWAYFFEKGLLRGGVCFQYIVKRWVHVFAVFVSWSLIHLIFKDEWAMPSVLSWLIRHFSGGAWAGQYFFLILLQLIPLFVIFRWCYERAWVRWSLVLAVSLLYVVVGFSYASLPEIMQKFKVRPFIYYIPYVFCGIALARGTFPRMSKLWLFAVVLPVIQFTVMEGAQMQYMSYITPAVFLGAIAVSAVAVQSSWSPAKESFAVRSLRAVGQNTLIIFVANPLVITFLAKTPLNPGPDFFPAFMEVPYSILFVSLVIAVCLLIAWIIRKLRLQQVLG